MNSHRDGIDNRANIRLRFRGLGSMAKGRVLRFRRGQREWSLSRDGPAPGPVRGTVDGASD